MKSRHGAIVSDPLNPDVTIAVDQNATLPAFVDVSAITVMQRDGLPIQMTQEEFHRAERRRRLREADQLEPFSVRELAAPEAANRFVGRGS